MMGPELLGRLLEEKAPALVLYARQWCSAPEDVVQEAFVKLVAQSTPPDNPVAWLFKVVRHGALTARRAGLRRQRHEIAAAQTHPQWFEPALGAALDADAVVRALEWLSAEQREVITLHLWGDLTFAQIAEVSGCSPSTAHRWYLDGLTRLRERLDAPCPSIIPDTD